jgi:hypothetical protein
MQHRESLPFFTVFAIGSGIGAAAAPDCDLLT